jgi:membrane protein DedA with SNARE-associated domain
MTETLLALIPTYGLWLILGSLILSCLAVPVPSSMLVMAAGGFAAGGDLVLWQVITVAFVGFVIGDQLAYGVARCAGTTLTDRLRNSPHGEAVIKRSETLLDRKGSMAVFLSRTIVSPLGPYLGYLCGALRMRWDIYTLAAVLGAACWSLAYSSLGYVFATQLTKVASLISNGLGIILALTIAVGIGAHIRRSWRKYQKNNAITGVLYIYHLHNTDYEIIPTD